METKPNNAAVIDQQSTEVTDLPVADPQNADASQGFPTPDADVVPGPVVVPEVDKALETPVEDQTPAEGDKPPVETPEDSEAIVDRLKQNTAKDHKLLAALGIDPLSDIGEQLEKGIITPEDIQRHVADKYQPATAPRATDAPVAKSAVDAAEEALVGAETKYNKEAESGGVSIETNNALRQADKVLNDAKLARLTDQVAADRLNREANENVEAVLSVAHEIPEFATMEQPRQAELEQVSLALTGFLADQKSPSMGLDPRKLTTQQLSGFAQDANAMLGNLAEFYREAGRTEVRASLLPKSPQPPGSNLNVITPVVDPANNTGSAIPAANPYAKVNAETHKEAAAAYAKSQQQM